MDSLSTTTLFEGCERALWTEMGTMHGTARPADGHSSVQGALQPRCCKAPSVALTDAVLAPRQLDSSLQVDESTVVGEERHELLDVTFVVNLQLPLNHCQRVGVSAPSHFGSGTPQTLLTAKRKRPQDRQGRPPLCAHAQEKAEAMPEGFEEAGSPSLMVCRFFKKKTGTESSRTACLLKVASSSLFACTSSARCLQALANSDQPAPCTTPMQTATAFDGRQRRGVRHRTRRRPLPTAFSRAMPTQAAARRIRTRAFHCAELGSPRAIARR